MNSGDKAQMSKHILLVDDSDTTRKATRLLIESQLDLEVCGEAIDGVEAIGKAKALKPDLIILDLAMPRMNGIETAAQLRMLLPDVPIVLFTLYDEAVGHALASDMGVNVISKPHGGWKLLDCIHGLLRPV